MPRVPFLSAHPTIAIADEPGIGAAADPLAYSDGFEIVRAWQARRPRRRRRLWTATPVLAVAVAAVLGVGREHSASALRERPTAAPTHALAPGRALVLSASAERVGTRDVTRPAATATHRLCRRHAQGDAC